MSAQGRMPQRWKHSTRLVQLLIAVLVISGLAIAAGVILSSINKTQTVVGVPIFLDANCNGVDNGFEQFSNVSLGQAFTLCLGVKNSASTSVVVHVDMTAACPVNGTVSLSKTGSYNDLVGSDGQLPCTTSVIGVSKTITALSQRLWNYSITYTGATGNYAWTFSAVSG